MSNNYFDLTGRTRFKHQTNDNFYFNRSCYVINIELKEATAGALLQIDRHDLS